jgi:protein-S-isoprenylcysteine O-methyltransferase Ste14
MTANDIEKAEGLSRARAVLMAIAALVLAINLAIQFGKPAYVSSDVRGASWIVVIGLWTFMLWNGGGLRPAGRMKALLNDELSLQNRARALAAGFYAAMLVSLGLFVAQWFVPISTGDALKSVSAAALCAALLRYAWLEWR